MSRRHDWVYRLNNVVTAAADRPYVLGEWDCLRFACACIDAMTGRDYWPRFAGYSTKLQALRTIRKIAPTFHGAVTVVIESEPIIPALAQRGDIVMYSDAAGEEHLGVCIGTHALVLTDTGTLRMPMADGGILYAWRVE